MPGQELFSGVATIASPVVLEGLLSVDNVLGIAALASELPQPLQRPAIRVGLVLAYAFRVLALWLPAGWRPTRGCAGWAPATSSG